MRKVIIGASLAGAAIVLLAVAFTTSNVNKSELLDTKLAEADPISKNGKPVSLQSLWKDGESPSEFPGPNDPRMQLKSPKEWKATFNTNVGPFTVLIHRDWAPKGADRFYSLVMNNFYDDARFFRYAENFVVQWGLKGDPQIDELYESGANIQDDPQNKGNKKGRITFATSGPNTRSTQVFVNLADNSFLDDQGFTPFGELASEDDLQLFQNKVNAEYGEKADQNRIISQGNMLYLKKTFPHMSYIKTTAVEVVTP